MTVAQTLKINSNIDHCFKCREADSLYLPFSLLFLCFQLWNTIEVVGSYQGMTLLTLLASVYNLLSVLNLAKLWFATFSEIEFSIKNNKT